MGDTVLDDAAQQAEVAEQRRRAAAEADGDMRWLMERPTFRRRLRAWMDAKAVGDPVPTEPVLIGEHNAIAEIAAHARRAAPADFARMFAEAPQ